MSEENPDFPPWVRVLTARLARVEAMADALGLITSGLIRVAPDQKAASAAIESALAAWELSARNRGMEPELSNRVSGLVRSLVLVNEA